MVGTSVFDLMANMDEPKPARILIYIEPSRLAVIGVAAGFLYGLLMVVLDPWLRFPDVPLRVNWREALLTASIMGGYAALLGWTVTTFWRSRLVWVMGLLMTPIITGILAMWNNINAAFGLDSDLLVFLPVVLVFHMAMIGLVNLYLRMALHSRWRQGLAYTAIPIVLSIFAFLGLGRLRWANQDAADVVEAVNRYAEGIFDRDYSIEFMGIRYRDQIAPTGDARIHTDDQTLYCRVRLYPENTDISCTEQE